MKTEQKHSSVIFHHNSDLIRYLDNKFSDLQNGDDFVNTRLDLMKSIYRDRDSDSFYALSLDDFKNGIYSPHQLIMHLAAEIADHNEFYYDYPFMFSICGYYLYTIVSTKKEQEYNKTADVNSSYGDHAGCSKTSGDNFTPNMEVLAREFSEYIQTMFYLRELREEGERLSLELVLPNDKLSTDSNRKLKIKQLAQIFGRGVGYSQELDCGFESKGNVSSIFTSHKTAPQSLLYDLKEQFPHLDESQVSITLRRDGLVTIAEKQNPLLEYYNGSWNVVDIKSSSEALVAFLTERFDGNRTFLKTMSEKLMNLAYHLASHWHGAILVVVDDPSLDDSTVSSEDCKLTTNVVRDQIDSIREKNPEGSDNKSDLELAGIGRLLLSLSLQDGAIIFNEHGKFCSYGNFITSSQATKIEGGARKKASKSLSKHGVVISISHDGGIVIFYTEKNSENCIELRVR